MCPLLWSLHICGGEHKRGAEQKREDYLRRLKWDPHGSKRDAGRKCVTAQKYEERRSLKWKILTNLLRALFSFVPGNWGKQLEVVGKQSAKSLESMGISCLLSPPPFLPFLTRAVPNCACCKYKLSLFLPFPFPTLNSARGKKKGKSRQLSRLNHSPCFFDVTWMHLPGIGLSAPSDTFIYLCSCKRPSLFFASLAHLQIPPPK